MNLQNNKELTGYPSIDKPWLKYYSEEAINAPLPECTIYEYLWENNKNHLDDVALIYFGKKITYRKLFENIDKVAQALIFNSVKSGDIVIVAMPSIPEALYSILAINRIGAIANVIHPLAGANEICNYINETKSNFLLMFDDTYNIVWQHLNKTSVRKAVVVSPANSLSILERNLYTIKAHKNNINKYDIIIKWQDFIKIKNNISLPNFLKHDSPAIISHTGGTTGEPKGVVLTNYNIVAEVWQIGCNLPHQRQESMLVVLPPFVNYSLVNGMLEGLAFGFKTILIPNYNPNLFYKYVKQYRPNNINSIPVYWEVLLNDKKIIKTDLSCLKYIAYGGEAMLPEKEEKVNNILSSCGAKCKLIKGLGSTELTSGATITYSDCNVIGSVGIPLVKGNCKIIEPETTLELTYNQEGEICFTGPTLMVGYYENIKATNDIIKIHEDEKRWLHTGDLGYMDTDGVVYVTGRIKRIIMTKGDDEMVTKMFPSRIEQAILHHPNVSICCVVGVSDPSRINRPYAVIVLKNNLTPNSSITTEILQYCRDRLPQYMIPQSSDIRYLDKMPRTSRGKVDYKALEKLAEEKENEFTK